MKLFTLLATLVAVTSAGHVFNQIPSEVYQAMGYHQAQDHQQSNEFGHGFDGGFQGHRVVQSIQHQPVQHQNIQTHHDIHQASQPHHIQFQSQPQHDHIQSQQVHFQGQSDQGSHIGQVGGHIGHSKHNGQISQNNNQNSGENNYNKQARILSYQHDFDEHNYQYAYETENEKKEESKVNEFNRKKSIKAQEVGTTTGEGARIQGAYSYTGDDGQVYTVTYTADENGFHPSGAHLPTPPPIPEAIARSIEHNLRDEANGIVDDGHYHHQYDHDQNIQQSQQHHQKHQPSHGLFQQLQRHNHEQIQQQQPSTIVQQQVQQQKPEQQQQPKQQQQLSSLNLFQPIKSQNVIEQEPQRIVLQVQQKNQDSQSNVNQQQQSLNQLQHPQRQQKRIHLQQQIGSIQQRPHVVMQQQILPHVEEHRHVEYLIPTYTKNFRHQRTDDYVGPAPVGK